MSSKTKIFNNEDYNSPDGMMTSIWGPPMWHTLHTISFNYPVNPSIEDKKNYYNFFISLKDILPCRYCRDNLKDNLKKNPLNIKVFKSRETLSKWVYLLHEKINSLLNKKSNLTYEDVRDRYENFRSRCLNNNEITKTKELGCTKSLYGIKSKCIINIVPKSSSLKTFNMDKKCIIKNMN
jgi:hypothetical protein